MQSGHQFESLKTFISNSVMSCEKPDLISAVSLDEGHAERCSQWQHPELIHFCNDPIGVGSKRALSSEDDGYRRLQLQIVQIVSSFALR